MKIEKKRLFTILILLVWQGFSQNENKKWYFGSGAGLDFMTNPPTILTNGSMYVSEGCSSIADSAGNLLFYSDGMTVWNKSHVVMANGTGLLGHPSATQSGVIIRKPGSFTLYYLFTLDALGGNNGVRYSIVDMSLAAGQGSVTVKNYTLFAAPCTEKLTAVKHCNMHDIWIVTHEFSTNNFQSYLLGNNGVNPTPVISSIGPLGNVMDVGQMKISPNGNKLGLASRSFSLYNSGTFELYDFNNLTGSISNSLSLGQFPTVYGAEFSADGTKFYGIVSQGRLLQWDLSSNVPSTIVASQYSLIVNQTLWAAQRAPDGKIYISRGSGSTLAVINNPNNQGAACNYQGSGQSIAPRSCQLGLPNFMGYISRTASAINYSISGCFNYAFNSTVTPLNQTSYCVPNPTLGISFSWNFGDPGSGSANTSTNASATHSFATPGSYTVQFIVFDSIQNFFNTLTQTLAVSFTTGLNISLSANTLCALPTNNSANNVVITVSGVTNPVFTLPPQLILTGLGNSQYNLSTQMAVQFAQLSSFTVSAMVGGCAGISIVTLDIISNPTITVNSVALCQGGSAIITCSGANSYSLSTLQNSVYASVPPGNVFSPTVTTLYSFIGESHGCRSAAVNSTIQVMPTPTLTLSPSTTTVCSGNNVTLTAMSNGISFLWSGSNIPTNNAQIVVSPTVTQNYSLIVTLGSCSVTAAKTITVFSAPVPIITTSNYSYCQNDSIVLNAVGADYYFWYGPSGLTSSVISFWVPSQPQNGGTYTLTGMNTNGCLKSTTIALIINPLPVLSIAANKQIICSGDSVFLTASGNGSSYNWINTPTTNIITQTAVVVFPTITQSFSVISALSGCTVGAAVTITVLPLPIPVIISEKVSYCVNEIITLTGIGAVFYSWSGSSGFAQQGSPISFTATNPLNSGAYTLTATGANGCTNKSVISLTVIPIPILNISVPHPTLCLGDDMLISMSGSFDLYQWFPSGNYMFSPTVNISPSVTQVYTVVAAIKNCSLSGSFKITVLPKPLPVAILQKDRYCVNEMISLQAEGGINYLWQTPPGLSLVGDIVEFPAYHTGFTGTYTLGVTNIEGCTSYTTFNMAIDPAPAGKFSGITKNCAPFCTTLSFLPGNESGELLLYNWKVTDQLYTGQSFSPCFTEAGKHIVTASVTGANGCVLADTVIINAWAKPQADFGTEPKTPVEGLDETLFFDSSIGDSLTSFKWYFSADQYSVSTQNCSYKFMDQGLQTVALVVENKYGCRDTIVKPVKVIPDFAIYVPDTFTPNGDNNNDVFLPVVSGEKQYTLRIYNRWGTKVFETTNDGKGWDGSFCSEPCKSDVYVCQINIASGEGETKELLKKVVLYR